MTDLKVVLASGKRQSWWKRITGVNSRGVGARAFKGEFLTTRMNELPPGTVLLHVIPVGTAVSKREQAELWRVVEGGNLERLCVPVDWKTELPKLKELARNLLKDGP